MGKLLADLTIDKLLGKMIEYKVSAKTERTGQVRAAKKCRMMLLILHIIKLNFPRWDNVNFKIRVIAP
jgi:hypothetical protein